LALPNAALIAEYTPDRHKGSVTSEVLDVGWHYGVFPILTIYVVFTFGCGSSDMASDTLKCRASLTPATLPSTF